MIWVLKLCESMLFSNLFQRDCLLFCLRTSTLFCFVSAWENFEFLSRSLSHSTQFFCFLNISSTLRASYSSFNTFASSSVVVLSFEYRFLTFSLRCSTSFSELSLFCLLHWLNSLRQLKICSIIFNSWWRSDEFHSSRITCLSSLIFNQRLSNLNFFPCLSWLRENVF